MLYQIIWLRLAFGYFGIITPVLSVVLSVFMLGLGLGAWLGGQWIEPLTRNRPFTALHVYAILELLTGFFACWVPFFFDQGSHWLLQLGGMNSWKYLLASGLVLCVSLLPSCFCMGCTTPVIMSYVKQKEASAETTFSFLYLANVLGAVLGTVLTAAVFIELWGFRHSTEIAVCANFALGILALGMAIQDSKTQPQSELDLEVSSPFTPARYSLSFLRVLLFLSGFVAMSFEVLWTRAYTAIVGTTVYAFASILAVYLSATWAGSALYRRHIRLGLGQPFPKIVITLATTSLLPVAMTFLSHPPYSVWALLEIIPCCGIFGYLLPALVDFYSNGQSKPAGQAYAINIIGCVTGPLVASYLFLPYLGVKNSIVLLSGIFLVAGLRQAFQEFKTFTWCSVGLTACFITATLLGPSTYDERVSESSPISVRRDYSATVVSYGQGMKKHLMVNGVDITFMTTITKVMAHLPLAFHSSPSKKALVICLGMGATFRSLCSWGIQTTAVELVPSVKAAFPYYFSDADHVLESPGATIVIDDGRRFLKRTSELFDVITLDPPPPPEAAGSSLLYSSEFYALVRAHLAPGGILQQWWPGGEKRILYSVARTVATSFPYVRVYTGMNGTGFHFLASNDPLPRPTVDEFIQRMPPLARADLLEWVSPKDLRKTVEAISSKEISLVSLVDSSADVLTDDHPYNEYYFLRRLSDLWHH